MNKLFKSIATAFVGIAMAIGVGVAVGHSGVHEARAADEEVTFTPSDFSAASSAATSASKSDVSISVTSGTITSDQIRIFKNQTITLSSVNNIKQIVFNCTVEGTAQYGPGCFAALDGYSYSGKVGTWSGTAKEVSLVASSNQVRATSIVVTVDKPSGDPQKQDVSSLVINGQATMAKGSSQTLTVTSDPANLSVTWESSKTSVATINENTGVVNAVSNGTTTITATFAGNNSYNAKTATLNLSVTVAEPSHVTGKTLAQIVEEAPAANSAIYEVSGYVTAWYFTKNGQQQVPNTDGTKYGNFYIADEAGDTAHQVLVYGASVEAECVWDAVAGKYTFSNPMTFLTNETTKDFAIGLKITAEFMPLYYNNVLQLSGKILTIQQPQPTKYEVSFAANGGSGTMAAVEVTENDEYTLPECTFGAPNENKEFEGWQVGSDTTKLYQPGEKITVTAAVVLTAQWKDKPAPQPTMYQVSFVGNGGTGSMQSVDVESGKTYELPQNGFGEPDGKDFAGWQVGDDVTKLYAAGEEITVTAAVVITAQWKDEPAQQATEYTIAFSANGGSGTMASLTKEEGSQIAEAPECTFEAPDENKEFNCWKDESGAPIVFPYTVTGNATFVADWKAKEVPQPTTYEITFDKNGGSGEMQAVQVAKDSEYTVPECTFDAPNADKEFAGWCINSDTTKVYQPGEKVTIGIDCVFHAQWKDKETPQPASYWSVATSVAAGDVLAIVNNDASKQLTGVDNNIGVATAYTDDPSTTYLLTVEAGSKANTFALRKGADYLAYTAGKGVSKNNNLHTLTTVTDQSSWTIEIENGEFTITNVDADDRTLQYNTANPRFACYTSAQAAVKLLKYSGEYSDPKPAATTYQVSFNSGAHGSGEMAAVTGISGSYTLPANGFTPEQGYSFAGWTVDNGTEVKQVGDQITVSANVILTAQWSQNTVPTLQYTISFDAGEGTGTMTALTKDVNAVIQEAPACSFTAPQGKVFDKWVDKDGNAIVFPYTVTGNATFYATYKAESVTPAETVVDVLNRTFTGQEAPASGYPSYAEWSGKTGTSGTVYAGFTNCDKDSIQLRTEKDKKPAPSGLFNTTSVGKVVSVEVTFQKDTADARTLDVYGKNSAFTSVDELFDTETQGQLIGSINKTDTTLKFTVSDTYQYIGIRSRSGAIYLSEIKIEWEKSSSPIVVNPTGVKLDRESATLEVGATLDLHAQIVPDGAEGTIAWESSNTAVATVVDGKVTAVSAGTASIKAKCGDLEAVCAVTVVAAGSQKGTATNPFTPHEANEECAKYQGTASIDDYYVRGIVSEIVTEYSEQYGNITFKITADGSTSSEAFYVYRCKGLNGANLTSASDIEVGDTVVVVGKIKTYIKEGQDPLPEMDANCCLYSITKGEGGGQGGGDTPTPSGKTLVSIEVVAPTKTDYFVDEALDLTGFKVILHFSDNSTQELTDLSKLGAIKVDTSRPGEKVVTITYQGKTSTFTINVKRNPEVHDGCHCSVLAGSALLSITTLLGAGLLMLRKRKEK